MYNDELDNESLIKNKKGNIYDKYMNKLGKRLIDKI